MSEVGHDTPRRPWLFGRISPAEVVAVTAGPEVTEVPTGEHGPHLVLTGGEEHTRRTDHPPAPPRRIRPPYLDAEELGVQLYGSRPLDLAAQQTARTTAAEALTTLRLAAGYGMATVHVQSLCTKRLLVTVGDAEAIPDNAAGIVPANGWAAIPVGGVKVVRLAMVDGTAFDGQVIAAGLEHAWQPGAGAL